MGESARGNASAVFFSQFVDGAEHVQGSMASYAGKQGSRAGYACLCLQCLRVFKAPDPAIPLVLKLPSIHVLCAVVQRLR
jgi:hypothetical protein